MSHIIGRRWSRIRGLIQGNTFTLVCTPKPAFYCSETFKSFLSAESDPSKHTINDIGLFYKIDNKVTMDTLFKACRMRQSYVEECKTFKGTHILIRKPALEIINCLKHANYDHPINKYVLFGKRGSGVSMTMNHIVHYAHVCDWLVVHVPVFIQWLVKKTERVQSNSKEGLIDLPALGSLWLNHFKSQNLNVINKFDLRLQNNYTWNIQEENKKGESLLNFLDHGISRGKYACDVMIGLIEEVKMLSRSGVVKTLAVLDNYSVLFHPRRKSSNRKYKNLGPEQLSFTEAFKNLAKADWHNGAVVLSCHSERIPETPDEHLPLNRLTLKGFEYLEPFVPIEVPELTDSEMSAVLDFYRSQKWLLTSEGDSELKILSAGNIATLKHLCGSV